MATLINIGNNIKVNPKFISYFEGLEIVLANKHRYTVTADVIELVKAYVENRNTGAFHYKGKVSSVSNLPSTGNIDGDMYLVTGEDKYYAWNGTSWDDTPTIVNISTLETAIAAEATRATGKEQELDAKINAKTSNIAISQLSESLKQYIEASGGGTITNMPDEEDLTVENNALMLKDHANTGASYSIVRARRNNGTLIVPTRRNNQNIIIEDDTNLDPNEIYDTTDFAYATVFNFKGGSLNNGEIKGWRFLDGFVSGNFKAQGGKTLFLHHYFASDTTRYGAVDLGKVIDKIQSFNSDNYRQRLTLILDMPCSIYKTVHLPAGISIEGMGQTISVFEYNSTEDQDATPTSNPAIDVELWADGNTLHPNQTRISNCVFLSGLGEHTPLLERVIIKIGTSCLIENCRFHYCNRSIMQTPVYFDGIIIRNIQVVGTRTDKNKVQYPVPDILLFKGDGTVLERINDGIVIAKFGGVADIRNCVNPALFLFHGRFHLVNNVRETGITVIYNARVQAYNTNCTTTIGNYEFPIIVDNADYLQIIPSEYQEEVFIDIAGSIVEFHNSQIRENIVLPNKSSYTSSSVASVGSGSSLKFIDCYKESSRYGTSGNNPVITKVLAPNEHTRYNGQVPALTFAVSNAGTSWNTGDYFARYRPDITQEDLVIDLTVYTALDVIILLDNKRRVGHKVSNVAFSCVQGKFARFSVTGGSAIADFNSVLMLEVYFKTANGVAKKALLPYVRGSYSTITPKNIANENILDCDTEDDYNEVTSCIAKGETAIVTATSLPQHGTWVDGDECVISGDGAYKYLGGSWHKYVSLSQ